MPSAIQQKEASPKIMSSPRSVDIEITSNCNLRCRYCYFFDNEQVHYDELPTQEWLKFFDELGSLGVMNLIIAGGEPFIRKDLKLLLDGIVRNKMRFSVLSNGSLIDDDIASFLAQTKRCDYVQVSIDGSNANAHDACRGKGSFEKAINGIKTLQKNNVNPAVRVTIHKNNVHDLENIAKFLLEDLKLSGFGTNSAGYIGTCKLNYEEVMLDVSEREMAMKTLLQLTEKYPGRIQAAAGPLAEGRFWKEMDENLKNHKPQSPSGAHLTSCGCPSNKISVRSDGAIIMCCMLAHTALGYINKDSLQEIWLNNEDLNKLRNRHKITLKEFEFCRGCKYIPYCRGGCPGSGYAVTGKIDHPSPDSCLRRYLEAGGKLN